MHDTDDLGLLYISPSYCIVPPVSTGNGDLSNRRRFLPEMRLLHGRSKLPSRRRTRTSMTTIRSTTPESLAKSKRTSTSTIIRPYTPNTLSHSTISSRDNEAEFLEKQTSALSAGTTWSRIADTLELGNSQSKTIARAGPGTTDLTRYKEVLLRLMREGENAPGAAGY